MKVEDERNKAFPTQFGMEQGMQGDPDRQYRVLNESAPLLEESIRHYSYDSEARHMLGDVYMQLFRLEKTPSRLDEGIKHLKRACELSPYSPHVFNSLAKAYWMMGNAAGDLDFFQKALEAELRASENFPVSPEYHEKLRQIYKSLGENEKAGEEARKAIELKKHYKLH
jgi:tetratricopeptide (TPR) repeat protein